jgi:hypothetical protein
MRRVFKTRSFARWSSKANLVDAALCAAVEEMSSGLIDADLGGGLVKKRVAMPGRGKRGGARTLLATNKASRWFFMFGFEKNERDTIDARELEALQSLAKNYLSLTSSQLAEALQANVFQEICHVH